MLFAWPKIIITRKMAKKRRYDNLGFNPLQTGRFRVEELMTTSFEDLLPVAVPEDLSQSAESLTPPPTSEAPRTSEDSPISITEEIIAQITAAQSPAVLVGQEVPEYNPDTSEIDAAYRSNVIESIEAADQMPTEISRKRKPTPQQTSTESEYEYLPETSPGKLTESPGRYFYAKTPIPKPSTNSSQLKDSQPSVRDSSELSAGNLVDKIPVSSLPSNSLTTDQDSSAPDEDLFSGLDIKQTANPTPIELNAFDYPTNFPQMNSIVQPTAPEAPKKTPKPQKTRNPLQRLLKWLQSNNK